jgi:hypothetical protein
MTVASTAVAAGTAPSATVGVAGVAQVGNTLQVAFAPPAPWAAAGIQWLRSGQPIDGANGPAYLLTPADAGAPVSVRVTALRAGYGDVIGQSNEFTIAPGGEVPVLAAVAGTPGVGGVLTATHQAPPEWTAAYQWLRGGTEIPGATAATYAVTPADAGATLAVRVTATRPGHVAVQSTTIGRPVPKSAPKVSLTAVNKRIPASTKARLRVAVTVPGVAKPAGKIVVTFGSKSKTYTLSAAKNGKLTVTLPKLKPATYAITATLKAGPSWTEKKSKRATVTVTR